MRLTYEYVKQFFAELGRENLIKNCKYDKLEFENYLTRKEII